MYTKTFYEVHWVPLELVGTFVDFNGFLLSSREYYNVVGIILGPLKLAGFRVEWDWISRNIRAMHGLS